MQLTNQLTGFKCQKYGNHLSEILSNTKEWKKEKNIKFWKKLMKYEHILLNLVHLFYLFITANQLNK